MAAPTYTLATVSKNPDGTYTLGNRPASAYSLATAGAGGGRPPLPYTNFDGSGGGGGAGLDDTVSLSVLQALPTTSDVTANFQYACSSDLWNNATGGTVWVLGLKPDAYWPVGIGTVNGTRQLVTIDVAAATYAPFAGGAAGTPRDPYDVPTAKRKEVVDANVPAYAEADSDYYGKKFLNLVYGSLVPTMYECMPSAPASTGSTVWYWVRFDVL